MCANLEQKKITDSFQGLLLIRSTLQSVRLLSSNVCFFFICNVIVFGWLSLFGRIKI